MEQPRRERPVNRCPECGGDRVAWRVKRLRASGRGIAHLALQLDCRECGASWEEGLGGDLADTEGGDQQAESPAPGAAPEAGPP